LAGALTFFYTAEISKLFQLKTRFIHNIHQLIANGQSQDTLSRGVSNQTGINV
jgi:hypothetical protein